MTVNAQSAKVGLKVLPDANPSPLIARVSELTLKQARDLVVHPAANLFPMIADAEFAQLKEDVSVHGLREPAWVWQEPGRKFAWLVDGRNRRRVCADLGIPLPVRYWQGDGSLVEFVMSLNFHRRQLSIQDRIKVAAKALPLLEEEARKRQEASQAKPGEKVGQNVGAPVPTPTKGRAAEQAAKAAGVSRRSVQNAKKVLTQGTEELKQAFEQNKVSAKDAARVANLPADQQLEALRKVEEKGARTLAEAIAADDWEAAVKRGTAKLRQAHSLFAALPGEEAVAVAFAVNVALGLATELPKKPQGEPMPRTSRTKELHRDKQARSAKPSKRTPPTWVFDVPGHGQQSAAAFTKGEARAEIKKRLGLESLPPGTTGEKAKGKKQVA